MISAPRLINWIWLQDLVTEALEGEIQAFIRAHTTERFYAMCLEFDPATGTFALSFSTHQAVDAAVAALSEEGEYEVCYRAVELLPEYFQYRQLPVSDPDGFWQAAQERLAPYRETLAENDENEIAQFLWLRFAKLMTDCLARLLERNAFRRLPQEEEFLVFATTEHESLEELEDRIQSLYPLYARATVEQSEAPRYGLRPSARCRTEGCSARAKDTRLLRCTYCQGWWCDACWESHHHSELNVRRPLFQSPEGLLDIPLTGEGR